jgi:hypothetical protein
MKFGRGCWKKKVKYTKPRCKIFAWILLGSAWENPDYQQLPSS